jgi:hypothetical protein
MSPLLSSSGSHGVADLPLFATTRQGRVVVLQVAAAWQFRQITLRYYRFVCSRIVKVRCNIIIH